MPMQSAPLPFAAFGLPQFDSRCNHGRVPKGLVADFRGAHSSKMTGASDPVLFDATLRPNPPMAAPILRAILIVVTLVNLGFGLNFVLRGAWPIAPFMGADVALLAWAFHASTVAARQYERVSLTVSRLLVTHHPPRGAPRQTELNPYWVRVELNGSPESRGRLFLTSHGRTMQIGSFLAPPERLSLAKALKAALRRARETRPGTIPA